MKFTINNQLYMAHFERDFMGDRNYQCFIHQGECNRKKSEIAKDVFKSVCLVETLYEGKAVIKRGDCYVKTIGRKKAFQSALRNSKLSREDKSSLWEQYFTQDPEAKTV